MSKEIKLNNFVFIESETDKWGFITRINPDFVSVSGYSENELIGKQHNIIRHPDMPSYVFKEMWETLYDGRTFKGIIKNKTKNDNYYWVKATIKPFKDKHNDVSGYISIRVPATDEEIKLAKEKYNIK